MVWPSYSSSGDTRLTGENRLSLSMPSLLNQDWKQPVPSEQHCVVYCLVAHVPYDRQQIISYGKCATAYLLGVGCISSGM